MAINSPLTAIASDGGISEGKGHPRSSGTYARVLGHYVREAKSLTLNEAIRKMALMPAQRLEKLAPAFRNKGRIKLGADADIAVFDPNTVIDKSTYQAPADAGGGIQVRAGQWGSRGARRRNCRRDLSRPSPPARPPLTSDN